MAAVQAAPDGGTDPLAGGAELPTAGPEVGTLRVKELRLRNVPLAVALKYICDQTKLRYKVDDFAVTLVPQTESGEDIFTRTVSVCRLTFQVPLDTGGRWRRCCGDPIHSLSQAAGGGSSLTARPPILDLLKTVRHQLLGR